MQQFVNSKGGGKTVRQKLVMCQQSSPTLYHRGTKAVPCHFRALP